MKKRIGILFVVWVIELYAFLQWFHCWQFSSIFYFTPQTLANTLLNATNGDKGVPLLLTRMLHNKPFALSWGLMQAVLQYWDIRFLSELLGVAGAIGVFFAMYYLLTKQRKNLWVWSLIGLTVLFSLVEAFVVPHIPFTYRIIPLTLIFQTLSLYGIWHFVRSGRFFIRFALVILLVLLSLLSLWLQPHAYLAFCLKV